MSSLNYLIHGTIRFYLDGVLNSTGSFETNYQRRVLIRDFLKKTEKIQYRVEISWIISVDEKTFNNRWCENQNDPPVIILPQHHTETYVKNNTRKYG